MRFVFVRHGHPNYELDCLTELGKLHAQAAAQRIKDEGITEIYASSCGRAYETAQYTAAELQLPVTKCDFIREIRWHSKDGTPLFREGNPWFIAWDQIAQGNPLTALDWQQHEPYCHSVVVDQFNAVSKGVDEWLLSLGYQREGDLYRVVGDNTDRTVAMFSHGGSSSCALSHIANLPFPYFCGMLPMDFTAITILNLSNEPGALTAPRFEVINEAHHIKGCAV